MTSITSTATGVQPDTITDAAKVARNARILATVLDALPSDVEIPTHTYLYTFGLDGPNPPKPGLGWLLFNEHEVSFEDQKARATAIIRGIGGHWDKKPGTLFSFETERRGVELHVTVDRQAVCERVVTGTREVTKSVPDPDVVVPTVEVTETVEDFEWRCAPLLADAVNA